jgi:hypothetical protein
VGRAKFRVCFSGGPRIESRGIHFVWRFTIVLTCPDKFGGRPLEWRIVGGGGWNIQHEIWRWLSFGGWLYMVAVSTKMAELEYVTKMAGYIW